MKKNRNVDMILVHENEQDLGPMTQEEVIQKLVNKELSWTSYFFDLGIRANRWKLILEDKKFQEVYKILYPSPYIKDLKLNDQENIFTLRKFPRIALEASILVHKNKEVWKGWTYEIGPGGVGFILDQTEVASKSKVGENVFIHLKAHEGLPSFNAIVTIVSAEKTKKLNVQYGVKFLKISRTVQQAILNFAENTKLTLNKEDL